MKKKPSTPKPLSKLLATATEDELRTKPPKLSRKSKKLIKDLKEAAGDEALQTEWGYGKEVDNAEAALMDAMRALEKHLIRLENGG